MREVPQQGLEIVYMYLDKLEKMTDKERGVLIKTIDLLNNPIFVVNE